MSLVSSTTRARTRRLRIGPINQGRTGTLSNWKDLACAEASRKAIFSAQLAQAGMTGPNQVFEGTLGPINRGSASSLSAGGSWSAVCQGRLPCVLSGELRVTKGLRAGHFILQNAL